MTTSNIGRPKPTSQSTNNPQVATQNNPSTITPKVSTGILQKLTPPTPIKYTVKPPPIRLQTGTVLSLSDVKYTENPNQSDNVPTFDGFTIDVSGDKIKPSIQKEFTLHLSGEKQIDP